MIKCVIAEVFILSVLKYIFYEIKYFNFLKNI